MLKQVIDFSTGDSSEQELTQEEIAEIVTVEEERQVSEAEEQAKREAKESALNKLAALGLTEEEAKAILGL